MDAELVRDTALSVSGLLTLKIGGPSVKPYQPPGYWAFLNFPMREWENDKGENLYRRGLYTHWQWGVGPPSLLAFDAPPREECTADRVRSNTPLQALVLLNDTTYVEAARVLAERSVKEGGGTDHDRLDWIFRQSLSRSITPPEEAVLLALLVKHRAEYAKDGAPAEELSKQGASAFDPLAVSGGGGRLDQRHSDGDESSRVRRAKLTKGRHPMASFSFERGLHLTRRSFLGRSSQGLGIMALGSLMHGESADAAANDKWQGVVQPLHHPPKAKRVIWLYMAGGMTHLETWDPKPKLAEMDGKPMPESVTKGQQIAQLQGNNKLVCLGPQHPFEEVGKVRTRIQQALSADRRKGGRRSLHHSFHAYRGDQSRSRPHVHEYRSHDRGPSLSGGVDAVRARK